MGVVGHYLEIKTTKQIGFGLTILNWELRLDRRLHTLSTFGIPSAPGEERGFNCVRQQHQQKDTGRSRAITFPIEASLTDLKATFWTLSGEQLVPLKAAALDPSCLKDKQGDVSASMLREGLSSL